MSESLKGSAFVITGANGNLGTHVVKAFADAGAIPIRVVRSIDQEGPHSFECDVTDEESVAACFSAIGDSVGGIAGLVHTVGAWAMQPFKETTVDSWRKMMDLNLTSAFLCFREATKLMSDGGSLIAIASKQGADGGVGQQAAYSAAKAGVVRLVESIAAEFADAGIRANAVAPYQIAASRDKPGAFAGDIARACVYLSSDTAAAISGTVIRMYG